MLPLKAWKDCVRCPKFQACDEIAVLRILRPEHWEQAQPQPWGVAMTSPADELIQIPTPAEVAIVTPKLGDSGAVPTKDREKAAVAAPFRLQSI